MVATGLIFLGVGAILALIGAFFLWRARRFSKTAIQVEGTVVGHVASESTDNDGMTSITYSPVVDFVTQTGEDVEFTDTIASSPPSHQEGEKVPVKYDPEKPQHARIATGFRLYFASVLVLVLGGVFAGIGVALAVAGL